MKKISVSRMFLAGLALAGISGCAMAGGGLTDQKKCFDSLDCNPGQICNQETRLCENAVEPTSVVDFELTPLQGSGGASTQIPNKNLANLVTADITLEVAPAIAVGGQVISPFAPGGVPGTLVVSRSPQIDNRRLLWNVPVGDSGYFSADIPPGTCDILFKPSNVADFSQLQIEKLQIPDEPTKENEINLSYPEYPSPEGLLQQKTLLLVRGQILQSQAYPHPVTGVDVEGVTDFGLRTNRATPDEQGYFFLRLPVVEAVDEQGKTHYTYPRFLDVTIMPGDSIVRLPTVTTTGIELDSPELGTFYIGEIPESRSISGQVVDTQGNSISECQVRFESDNIGNGSYTHQQSTVEGQFTTTLPAGTYRIMVVPPLDSELAIYNTTIELDENTSDLSIVLGKRLRLTGTVQDSEHNRIPDVIVQAKRLASVMSEEDGVIRSYEGVTDSGGNFSLPVDSGLYNVTFIPPAASGLPRTLPTRVYMIDQDNEMQLSATTLSTPAVVQGHVLDWQGQPMCGVTIEVFHSTETNAYLVGQAISKSEEDVCTGTYAVTIADSFVTPDEE